jgi:hypothetical protein
MESGKANYKIYGVAEGVIYQQNERVEDLNERIKSRHFPDVPLEPNYTPRAVPTKYSIFPIIDRKTPAKEEALKYVHFNPYINFNPGTANAPPSGYLNNVDTETVLRNQTFALQNCSQSVYVPSSLSELYNVRVISSPSEQPYPLLFQRLPLESQIHPNVRDTEIGRNVFFNATRTQLRNGM